MPEPCRQPLQWQLQEFCTVLSLIICPELNQSTRSARHIAGNAASSALCGINQGGRTHVCTAEGRPGLDGFEMGLPCLSCLSCHIAVRPPGSVIFRLTCRLGTSRTRPTMPSANLMQHSRLQRLARPILQMREPLQGPSHPEPPLTCLMLASNTSEHKHILSTPQNYTFSSRTKALDGICCPQMLLRCQRLLQLGACSICMRLPILSALISADRRLLMKSVCTFMMSLCV